MMEKREDIKAIICDWDDTKVNTFESVYELWNTFGFTIGEDFVKAGLGKEYILKSFAALPDFLENQS